MGQKRIRYGVIGQGYFAQAAILPAFKNTPNAELVAIFSEDPQKRAELRSLYDVQYAYGYDNYDSFLASGGIDAVYIALPNNQHRDYTVRAARAGVHVLCEKPMATSEAECVEMIEACTAAKVKLMIAYRLHFEEANLEAIEIARSGQLGEIRLFNSTFTMQVQPGNIRLRADLGGGPLNDIGVYCVNAARYIFQDEPVEVAAFAASADEDPRFEEVEEQLGVIMRFPRARIATFSVGFGSSERSYYEVVGSEGTLRVDPAYQFATDLKHELIKNGKSETRVFSKRDQIAPEIIYFSDCIIQNRYPEPSGTEGLADVRIIQAIEESARSGRAVRVDRVLQRSRPNILQHIHVPPHPTPDLIRAEPPSP